MCHADVLIAALSPLGQKKYIVAVADAGVS